MNLLESRNLSKHYLVPRVRGKELIRSVDGVTLNVPAGSSIGLVGESGSGKSTLLRLLLKLEEPDGGVLYFRGVELNGLPEKKLKVYRRSVQAVFQDAGASLNPRLVLERLIPEPLTNFYPGMGRGEIRSKVLEVLQQVGLQPGDIRRYAHEFSGGQRRRIAIARALISTPELIVCDEATSGLDVSVQAQLLNLLLDLREKYRVNYLFVSHDLAAVRYLCSRIAVMYGGQIVEEISTANLKDACHPYTLTLLAAEPTLQRSNSEVIIAGEPPDPAAFPEGCRFHPRCPARQEICTRESPPLSAVARSHRVACHLRDEK